MKNARTAIPEQTENPRGAILLARSGGLAISVLAFTLLTMIGARATIVLPGTPVPGTLQTLPVLMAGLFLGAGPGCLSQALYVALGLAGLPVFALPGAGPAYLLGPTGGYLCGFVAAPWVVGFAAGKHLAGPGRRLAALLLGLIALHACGFAGLLPHFSGSAGAALRAGVVPFFLFDLAKVFTALALHSGWQTILRRLDSRWRNASRS